MKAIVIIEKDGNGFAAYTDNLTTVLHGEGGTVQEAKAALLECYEEIKSYYLEIGEGLPDELKNIEFEYKYDVSALFNAFDFLNVTKFAKWIGVDASSMRHYKAGDTYISDLQAKKIENGLHQVARELLQVSL